MHGTRRSTVLSLIRMVHTVIFTIMAGSVFYVLYCGLFRVSGNALAGALCLVAVEATVFLANGRKCPLTALAQEYGAEKGYVFDSFFPERLTRYTFPFFTTTLLIGLTLVIVNALMAPPSLRATLGAAVALACVYCFFVQPWQQRWGTTDEEANSRMAGDESVGTPDVQTTRAITINARPEDIFPWLVQMGIRRGGLYSYDWLDRLFGFLDRPSETRIIPEFQDLKVGDVIPIGRGNGFPVTAIVRNRLVVLSGTEGDTAWSWQMVLRPIDSTHTRFLSRNRMRFPHTLKTRIVMFCLDLAAWIMVRKWLLNIKQRSENLQTVPARSAPNRYERG